jgi:hypothetical protein
MSERFELVGEHGDTSGHLRLAYGTGPDDPMLFVLSYAGICGASNGEHAAGHALRGHEIRLRQCR